MKQMCKKSFNPLCLNKLSNPRYFTVSTEPRLQTSVRQLGLESSLRHTQGWSKLIIYTIMVTVDPLFYRTTLSSIVHMSTLVCRTDTAVFGNCVDFVK